MSYLRLSRLALLVCVLVWGVAILAGLAGLTWEGFYLFGIGSSLVMGLLAANALAAQFVAKSRNGRGARHG